MLSGLQSNEVAEEDKLELEIHQRDTIWWVKFPLTRGHNSKCGRQVRERRIGKVDE
jgi:hypothetical protein